MNKKILVIMAVVLSLLASSFAAVTYDDEYYQRNLGNVLSGGSTDPIKNFINEAEGYLEGATAFPSLYFEPTDTAPTAAEGVIYASDADNGLKFYNGTAWVDIDVSGASSLATAYTAGSKILAPTLEVEIEVADSSNNPALRLDFDDATTNAQDVFIIDNAGDDADAVSIQINGTAGDDIRGTGDVWNVSYQGLGGLVGLIIGAEDLELENGGEIQNVVDTELRFMENSEDFILDFTTDGLTLKSGTGVVAIDFGDVDALTGINAIAFDAAVANTITQTGSGNTDDLTISQAGTADVSLILSSAGSITDALSLITTDSVGVIKISSSDVLDIDAVDDIDIDISDGTYTLTIGGSSDGDYVCTVADNMSMTVVGTMLLQNTEAASDITVNSVLGSVYIEGEEDAANAVLITADGGTSSTLRLHNDTGTGGTSIDLLSDVGGITATASAGLITLTATGGDAGDLTLTAGDVMTLTSVDTKIFDGAAAETWVIEGTADVHEAKIVFTDPTADVTYTVPVAAASTLSFMTSTLATNAPDIANSVTGGTSTLIFEGSGVDAHEHTLTAVNPTADIVWNLPDGAADTLAIMGSTLVTNMSEVADSIWGDTNKLAFEGATANNFETWITPTDPTADRTLTLPDQTGNVTVADTGTEIRTVVVEVTAAQIKDLAANQKELIAAPGSGKALKLISCLMILDNGGTDYDDAAGDGNMYICYINGAGLKATGSIEGDAFIDCAADFIIAVEPVALAATAATSIENDALVLDNDGAEYTTGDGTMTVMLTYAIISLGL